MSRPLSVGVVGLGYWGPNLARNFAAIPGAELTYFCDADEAARARVSRTLPAARATADLDELLGDPDLDAIVLATPVPTHAELAVRVLEAGQALLRREAPGACRSLDAERAVAAADAAGRLLMVGHLLEYHPGVRKLKELAGIRRAGRRDLLHLRQPPEPRQAARGRERPVEPGRP